MTAVMTDRPGSLRGRVVYVTRRALRMEIGVWQSLYRFVFRRPKVPAGASAFSYHKPVQSVLIVFIVLSVVETAIVDLIVHQWMPVRVPLLILGIWGVTFMVGMLLGYLTRPHAVGPDGIRVRHGAEIDIPLSWDDVASVALKKEVAEAKTLRISSEDDETTLHLRIQHETTIEIELERPVVVRLPQGPETVTALRIYVDEPRSFMDAVRRYL